MHQGGIEFAQLEASSDVENDVKPDDLVNVDVSSLRAQHDTKEVCVSTTKQSMHNMLFYDPWIRHIHTLSANTAAFLGLPHEGY